MFLTSNMSACTNLPKCQQWFPEFTCRTKHFDACWQMLNSQLGYLDNGRTGLGVVPPRGGRPAGRPNLSVLFSRDTNDTFAVLVNAFVYNVSITTCFSEWRGMYVYMYVEFTNYRLFDGQAEKNIEWKIYWAYYFVCVLYCMSGRHCMLSFYYLDALPWCSPELCIRRAHLRLSSVYRTSMTPLPTHMTPPLTHSPTHTHINNQLLAPHREKSSNSGNQPNEAPVSRWLAAHHENKTATSSHSGDNHNYAPVLR